MREQLKAYVYGCLAGSGLAVLTPGVAYRLRPDLWSSTLACASDLRDERLGAHLKSLGCQFYVARGEGGETLFVAARSGKRLAERLEEIVGIVILSVEENVHA